MGEWLCRFWHSWRWEDRSFEYETEDSEGNTYVDRPGELFRECRRCGKKQVMYAANWYTPQDVS